LRAGKPQLGISIQQITLICPGTRDFTFRLSPRPEPAGIYVAITDGVDNVRFSILVYISSIDISDILPSNFTAFDNSLFATFTGNEFIHDGILYLQSFMRLPGVFWKLSRSICKNN